MHVILHGIDTKYFGLWSPTNNVPYTSLPLALYNVLQVLRDLVQHLLNFLLLAGGLRHLGSLHLHQRNLVYRNCRSAGIVAAGDSLVVQ